MLIGPCQTVVVRSAPPTGAWGETFTEERQKQSKKIIDLL